MNNDPSSEVQCSGNFSKTVGGDGGAVGNNF